MFVFQLWNPRYQGSFTLLYIFGLFPSVQFRTERLHWVLLSFSWRWMSWYLSFWFSSTPCTPLLIHTHAHTHELHFFCLPPWLFFLLPPLGEWSRRKEFPSFLPWASPHPICPLDLSHPGISTYYYPYHKPFRQPAYQLSFALPPSYDSLDSFGHIWKNPIF